MTRNDLLKRLVKVEGTPILYKPPPRENIRRELNQVSNIPEHDLTEFDTFFDFEKDISDLESARNQVEKIEMFKDEASESKDESSSFVLLDEDDSIKSGNEQSFFIFEEELEEVNEIIIVQDVKEEIDDIVEPSLQENVTETTEVNLSEEKSVIFKICKYVKENGENCKRQAPKDSKYCRSHRKVLEKETS